MSGCRAIRAFPRTPTPATSISACADHSVGPGRPAGILRFLSRAHVAQRGDSRRVLSQRRVRSLRELMSFYVERDLEPEKFYPRNPDGTVHKADDLPPGTRTLSTTTRRSTEGGRRTRADGYRDRRRHCIPRDVTDGRPAMRARWVCTPCATGRHSRASGLSAAVAPTALRGLMAANRRHAAYGGDGANCSGRSRRRPAAGRHRVPRARLAHPLDRIPQPPIKLPPTPTNTPGACSSPSTGPPPPRRAQPIRPHPRRRQTRRLGSLAKRNRRLPGRRPGPRPLGRATDPATTPPRPRPASKRSR